jgi:hypothetical protein
LVVTSFGKTNFPNNSPGPNHITQDVLTLYGSMTEHHLILQLTKSAGYAKDLRMLSHTIMERIMLHAQEGKTIVAGLPNFRSSCP